VTTGQRDAGMVVVANHYQRQVNRHVNTWSTPAPSINYQAPDGSDDVPQVTLEQLAMVRTHHQQTLEAQDAAQQAMACVHRAYRRQRQHNAMCQAHHHAVRRHQQALEAHMGYMARRHQHGAYSAAVNAPQGPAPDCLTQHAGQAQLLASHQAKNAPPHQTRPTPAMHNTTRGVRTQ
jgi:hypothetical protein